MRSSCQRNTRPTGFATFTAVLLTASVGLALAASATVIADRLQRVHERDAAAQVDQLLLAGSAALVATGEPTDPIVTLTPDLPDDLKLAGTTLRIEPDADRRDLAWVRVTHDGRSASQLLEYRSGRWVVIQADRR